ncbi:PLP-dependent aminotransferase family protein [Telluria mixta]|uniref:PLP-dependent aminotransferase family protein n=1 Tax=Telluria mixta TaxID=34071 RepID=A0ABT2BX49_9BURK|nr:PLP-dependent aminotransferase family protein [Telluria mixta]MCS0629714.1 PLP-dependent aminotransferase family protein [Telluria mixta]WEM96719.1 PLP-dependent aminotransferase family protein [Telluria mixta]
MEPTEKSESEGWPVLAIDRQRRGSLVDQIVAAIAEMVNRRTLPAGTKMPSVRQFAKTNGVSTFTVVESYDRLLHLGLLSSRRGSGFFVARGAEAPAQQTYLPTYLPAAALVVDTLTPDLYSGQTDALPVGAGWLPPEWYGESTILDAVRHAMKIPAGRLRGYGHPLGFPSLRQHLATTLSADLFAVEPEQILLTHGATHAFDLVLRTLTRPGDVVFVEDPGYGNLLALVRHHGCVPVGIPRGAHGLDMEVLAREAQARQPKLMFVNTVLQNPLGTSLSQAQAHRLLALSEQYDFWLVEDDIYRELAARGDSSLAAMDGLRRVIRIGSFSKTLSPVLRVGSICASGSLMPELVRVKMLTGLTTSEVNERAVYDAVSSRAYRKQVERLVLQLDDARELALERLGDAGLVPLARPRGGMFVSAGLPDKGPSGRAIAERALRASILLAPGEFFALRPPDTAWFRFNVAYAHERALLDFLRSIRGEQS